MQKQPWTDAEVATLRKLYPSNQTAEVARALGRRATQVYNKANNMGLKKTSGYLSSELSGRITTGSGRGQAARFVKGATPWNKGKEFKAGGRSCETRFKRGNVPANDHPIGTERYNRDGILERKVGRTGRKSTNWRAVHALNWEEIHGPVPDGHVVIFKDGNRENRDNENLECISRSELMKRNSRHTRYPEEINRLIQLRGVLNRKIRQAR